MNTTELKKQINDALDEQFDPKEELDGDDFDTVESVVANICEAATEATDAARDEDEDDDPPKDPAA